MTLTRAQPIDPTGGTPLPAGGITERLLDTRKRYRVGATYYRDWSGAYAAVNDGGTIEVEAGARISGSLSEILKPITIRGNVDGDYPIYEYAMTAGKGCFLISAPGVTLEHLRFEHIGGTGDALAAIRLQTPFFTGRDLQGSHCENFILGGGAGRDANGNPIEGFIDLDHLTLDHCGHPNARAHAIYLGTTARGRLTHSKLYDTNIGHLYKSRAALNEVYDNVLREGRSSRALDLPFGGDLFVSNNDVHQDADTNGKDIIGYGAEIADTPYWPYWKSNKVTIKNNRLHNSGVSPYYWFNDWLKPEGRIVEAPQTRGPIPDIVMATIAANPVIPFTRSDAFWDALKVGQVYEVANTSMAALPARFPAGFKDFGVQGWSTWMNQYSGGAFDQSNGRMYITAGGHMASSNNVMVGFDFESMTSRIVMPPSVITQRWIDQARAAWVSPLERWSTFGQGINAAGTHDDEWPDGKPAAIHTYNNTAYLDGHVYRGGLLKMWQYDVATGAVKSMPLWIADGKRGRTPHELPSMAFGALMIADPVNKLIVRGGSVGDNYTDIRTFNPATGEIVIRPELKIGQWPMGGVLVGREIVCLGGYGSYFVAINLDTWAQRFWRPSERVSGHTGCAWAGDIARFLVPKVDGGIAAIDLGSGACSLLNIKGRFHVENDYTFTGPWSRFTYYPRRKALVLVSSVSHNVRVVRLAT